MTYREFCKKVRGKIAGAGLKAKVYNDDGVYTALCGDLKITSNADTDYIYVSWGKKSQGAPAVFGSKHLARAKL